MVDIFTDLIIFIHIYYFVSCHFSILNVIIQFNMTDTNNVVPIL